MAEEGFKFIKGNTELLCENISGKNVLLLGHSQLVSRWSD